jgi:AraC-like DNA-binding protein
LRPDAYVSKLVDVDALTTSSKPVSAHSVPGSQVLQWVELLDFWHIDAAELLDGTELSAGKLEEPNVRVPVDVYLQLLRRARKLTGEPALGIFMGLRRRVSMYGFLGFAAMSASSMREVLELAVQFSPLITTALTLSLQVTDDVAALRIEENFDFGDARDMGVFALLVGLSQMAKALTGRDVPGEAHVAMARPAYFDRFENRLNPMRFDQPVTQLIFDRKVLDFPLITPDRAGLRLAREQCERALRELGLDGGIVERVRALVTGPEGVRTLEQVASQLRMSARTLKRRLAAQRLSYSELLERERYQRAQLLLCSSELSLLEITERLGYSTLPNFARAFRRWTGQTPAAYRRSTSAGASARGPVEPAEPQAP